ncbi:MAG: hypothetical protein OK404_03000 [Thaumarchaeota archaeon]|nr:hypothetical protein [Nitrososphaerota archaeon]
MDYRKLAVSLGLLCLLLSASPVYADSNNGDSSDGHGGDHSHNHQNLSLALNGVILDAGTGDYSHQGGEVVAASLLGTPVDPSNAQMDYSLQAHVVGLSVFGSAQFDLSVNWNNGSSSNVHGDAVIGDMVPAEMFPTGCTTPGVDCFSAIPGFFLGFAAVTVTTCQAHHDNSDGQSSDSSGDGHDHRHGSDCATVAQMTLPMQFESAFLNPFGGPIFLASAGGEIFVVSTYSEARVTWTGTQLGGVAAGSLAGNPVAGQFAMSVNAVEDLKNGNEIDRGTIAFLGMSDPSLNAAGKLDGRSTIPPGADCSAAFGLPPGTCQLTGFSSDGHFRMSTDLGGSIKGDYHTDWTVPAVAFSSTVSGSLR